MNEVAPYDPYYDLPHNAHTIGAMYFGALEQDYGCYTNCVSEILYLLYEYRQNCTGDCLEDVKSKSSFTKDSLSMNDLRISVITNALIKKTSEKVIGQNLTLLFDILDIDY